MSGLSRETRLQIMLDESELAAIDDWRFTQRMPSRAAAIRELLQIGLRSVHNGPADQGRASSDFGVFEKKPKPSE